MNFGKSLFNDGLCVIIICSALMWVIWTVRENEDIRGVKENEKEILEYLEKWKETKSHAEEYEFIDSEAKGIKYILDNEEVFDYKIGGVYVDDKLVRPISSRLPHRICCTSVFATLKPKLWQ